jgi:hypothetical protein
MDTGKVMDTSTGKKSTKTPTLASASGKGAKPSRPAQTKKEKDNFLETLAELLSLIQEDCRRYKATLAEYLPNQEPIMMQFDGDGIIYIAAPPGHRLDTGKGHILLDGRPVTGWSASVNTDKESK